MKPDNTQKASATLDFSPLREPVTEADIMAFKSFERGTDKANKIATVVIAVFIGSFLFALIVRPLIAELRLGGLGTILSLVSWVGTVAGALYVASLILKAATKRSARLYKFAVRNNLTFMHGKADPGYAGMIFNEGHSRNITLGFVFPGRAEIGNYVYITGSGKNRHEHPWGYIRVKMPRKLPNMVLDAKRNNIFGSFTNLPDVFKKDQRLSLEGDFNNHFTLYAPKEYERDALYVFTPDVMASLIDKGGDFDMEVVDDELFIYKSGSFSFDNEIELTSLLAIVDSIGGELREQTDYYADERVGDRTQNVVALPGTRLKHGVHWIVIVIIVIIAWQFLGPFLSLFFRHN